MLRIMKFATPVVAFAMLLTLAGVAMAADSPSSDKGKISGTVVDHDGKPVAGAHVRLFHPMQRKHGDNANKPDNQAITGTPRPQQLAKHDRPQPVAQTTTDNDGKFTLDDVDAGDYVIMANLKGQGAAHQKVTVKGGDTATVTLTLEARGAGHGHGHGQNQAKPHQQ